jgi:hypothetical protein
MNLCGSGLVREFEPLTDVAMKTADFWVVTPYSLERYRYFGGRSILPPSSRSSNKPRKKPVEAGDKLISIFRLLLLVSCLAFTSTLKMEAICSSEALLAFAGLQGVVSQKMESFRSEEFYNKKNIDDNNNNNNNNNNSLSTNVITTLG